MAKTTKWYLSCSINFSAFQVMLENICTKFFNVFFWFMRVLDLDSQYWSGQIQNIESLKSLYSVRWGGNKWPRRPLGVNYSLEACGHCVKVGLVVLLLKRELDSLMECLRWWWSGWPPLLVTMWVIPEGLGNFSPKKEKNLGEQKFASFGIEFSR